MNRPVLSSSPVWPSIQGTVFLPITYYLVQSPMPTSAITSAGVPTSAWWPFTDHANLYDTTFVANFVYIVGSLIKQSARQRNLWYPGLSLVRFAAFPII